jgi:hypothetical protein
MSDEMMIDRSDMFFDCPHVKVVEKEKTLFGYWYKVRASYLGMCFYNTECDNSDCEETLEAIKKWIVPLESYKIPPHRFPREKL